MKVDYKQQEQYMLKLIQQQENVRAEQARLSQQERALLVEQSLRQEQQLQQQRADELAKHKKELEKTKSVINITDKKRKVFQMSNADFKKTAENTIAKREQEFTARDNKLAQQLKDFQDKSKSGLDEFDRRLQERQEHQKQLDKSLEKYSSKIIKDLSNTYGSFYSPKDNSVLSAVNARETAHDLMMKQHKEELDNLKKSGQEQSPKYDFIQKQMQYFEAVKDRYVIENVANLEKTLNGKTIAFEKYHSDLVKQNTVADDRLTKMQQARIEYVKDCVSNKKSVDKNFVSEQQAQQANRAIAVETQAKPVNPFKRDKTKDNSLSVDGQGATDGKGEGGKGTGSKEAGKPEPVLKPDSVKPKRQVNIQATIAQHKAISAERTDVRREKQREQQNTQTYEMRNSGYSL